jgi:hypothetical protein
MAASKAVKWKTLSVELGGQAYAGRVEIQGTRFGSSSTTTAALNRTAEIGAPIQRSNVTCW